MLRFFLCRLQWPKRVWRAPFGGQRVAGCGQSAVLFPRAQDTYKCFGARPQATCNWSACDNQPNSSLAAIAETSRQIQESVWGVLPLNNYFSLLEQSGWKSCLAASRAGLCRWMEFWGSWSSFGCEIPLGSQNWPRERTKSSWSNCPTVTRFVMSQHDVMGSRRSWQARHRPQDWKSRTSASQTSWSHTMMKVVIGPRFLGASVLFRLGSNVTVGDVELVRRTLTLHELSPLWEMLQRAEP